jgi:hypothetical protein
MYIKFETQEAYNNRNKAQIESELKQEVYRLLKKEQLLELMEDDNGSIIIGYGVDERVSVRVTGFKNGGLMGTVPETLQYLRKKKGYLKKAFSL